MSRSGKDSDRRVKTGRGRTASSVRWLERQLNDPYVKQAKAEGYRSRAAYKLIELDDRFGLVKGSKRVVDLGIPDEWVDWFREAVRRGTTTVLILAEDLDVRALEDEVKRFAGAELVHATLPAATIDQLRTALGDAQT